MDFFFFLIIRLFVVSALCLVLNVAGPASAPVRSHRAKVTLGETRRVHPGKETLHVHVRLEEEEEGETRLHEVPAIKP